MQIMFQIDVGDHEGPFIFGPLIPDSLLFADTRNKDQEFWEEVVASLFREWKDEVKEPDTDEDFLTWLVEQRGWEWPIEDETLVVYLD
tara:strand:+ start:934 stop:1197 length:264 start_codon:yes stop_codon:yes gene_type:complete